MDVNNTMEFIQNVYGTKNISHSLVVFDKNIATQYIEDLYKSLLSNDFPVFKIKENNMDEDKLTIYEQQFRMFLIDINCLQQYIVNKRYDLSNISVVFCLSEELLNSTYKVLNNSNILNIESLHLFSV